METSTPNLSEKMAQIVDQHGAWTAFNASLGSGVYTIGETVRMSQERHIRSIVQTIADTVKKPFSELRILDLACLEGIYSVELALHGAEVVGIEGRESNVKKADFVKDALKLKNLKFVKDDVRNLSREKYGTFDVVLCAGILYHLNAPDLFYFLEKVYEVTNGLALIDTHYSLTQNESLNFKGTTYHGLKFLEHAPESTQEEREKSLHASLDNTYSFWLSKNSLLNFLGKTGFTSIFEAQYPAIFDYQDRAMFLAFKGQETKIRVVEKDKAIEGLGYPEDYSRVPTPLQCKAEKSNLEKTLSRLKRIANPKYWS